MSDPRWTVEYRRRVGAVMDQLRADDRLVLWVTQPPMRDPGSTAASPWSTRPSRPRPPRPWVVLVDRRCSATRRAFADLLPDASGNPDVRRNDGIHLTEAGGGLLATHVLGLLGARVSDPLVPGWRRPLERRGPPLRRSPMVSALFDADAWRPVEGFELTDITYHRAVDVGRGAGGVRPARGAQRLPAPHGRRAVPGARPRPPERRRRLRAAHRQRAVAQGRRLGLLLGRRPAHPGPRRLPLRRGRDGRDGRPGRTGRLHILEVQRLIRFMPKVVICLVPGWAAGGGHSLHVVCDLTLASREHARFRQTDTDVASFDGGFGSAYLARQVGQKFAREIFFLGDTYTAEDAHRMGMVNAVVPHEDLERVGLDWGRRVMGKSPTASAWSSSPSTSSTTGWWASRCSPARPPGWPTAPPRRPEGGTPSWSGAPRLVGLPVALLT